MTCGIMAMNSAQFDIVSQMISTETNESFDFDKAVLALVLLGAAAVAGGLFGCYGAWAEHRGALAGYSTFAFLFGLLFVGMGLAMLTFLDTTWPLLVKKTNRICINPIRTKTQLSCPVPADVQVKQQLLPPTVPPTIMASTKNLARLLRGFDVPLTAALLTSAALDTWVEQNATRRLKPGSTENHFLMRLCDYQKQEDAGCESVCSLIETLCEPPMEFFPKSACLCAGVATPGSEIGVNPVREGAYCSAWTEDQKEWCYTLASAECPGWPTEAVGGEYGKSSGPCYVPSSRSKVMQEGGEAAHAVSLASILLGVCLLFSIVCTCCFCFELHTGKKAHKHLNNLANGDSSSDEERY